MPLLRAGADERGGGRDDGASTLRDASTVIAALSVEIAAAIVLLRRRCGRVLYLREDLVLALSRPGEASAWRILPRGGSGRRERPGTVRTSDASQPLPPNQNQRDSF